MQEEKNSRCFQRAGRGAASTPECAHGFSTHRLRQNAARPARSQLRPNAPESVRGCCPWCWPQSPGTGSREDIDNFGKNTLSLLSGCFACFFPSLISYFVGGAVSRKLTWRPGAPQCCWAVSPLALNVNSQQNQLLRAKRHPCPSPRRCPGRSAGKRLPVSALWEERNCLPVCRAHCLCPLTCLSNSKIIPLMFDSPFKLVSQEVF
jgi:hypothetical protein